MGLAPTPRVQIDIPGALPDGRLFLGWVPVQAQAKLIPGPMPPPFPPGPLPPVPITLRNGGTVGKLRFAKVRTGNGSPTLALQLPAGAHALVA